MPDLGHGLPELTGIAFNVNYLPPGNDYDSYPGGIYLDNMQWSVTLGTINVLKFFDPNGNGIQDSGEVPMPGWTIKLMKMDSTGAYNVVGTDTTDPQGETSFADLESGTYAVTEEYPGLTWTKITRAPAWCDRQTSDGKYLFTKASLDGGIFDFDYCGYAGNAPRVDGIVVGTDAHDITFGNVGLKMARGGYSVSDWYRKNNNWLNNYEPAWRHLLNGFCLVGPTGSSFDVSLKSRSGSSDFKTWLQKAQAVNMAYTLSAQLAATALNTHFRGLDPDTAILLPASLATCYGSEFVTIGDVMAAAGTALCNDRYTPKGDPNRAPQECLTNILAGINNNSFRFLSPTPQM